MENRVLKKKLVLKKQPISTLNDDYQNLVVAGKVPTGLDTAWECTTGMKCDTMSAGCCGVGTCGYSSMSNCDCVGTGTQMTQMNCNSNFGYC